MVAIPLHGTVRLRYISQMRIAREITELAVEFLDVWGSEVSLGLLLLSGVTFVLSSLGLLNDPIGEHSRAMTDKACFAGAAIAGLLRLIMLIRRLTFKPHIYEDPKTVLLPNIDYSDHPDQSSRRVSTSATRNSVFLFLRKPIWNSSLMLLMMTLILRQRAACKKMPGQCFMRVGTASIRNIF
jgi:hypothetical protein